MNNKIMIPALLGIGAVIGLGTLFMLIELLPFIVIGGVGFLIWKLTSIVQETQCNSGPEKK